MPRIRILVEVEARAPEAAFSMEMSPELPRDLPGLPFEVDDSFGAIPFAAEGAHSLAATMEESRTSVVLGEAHTEEIKRIRKTSGVLNVFSDPEVMAFAAPLAAGCGTTDCDASVSKGDAAAVANALGTQRAWDHGFRGQGVVIGVVDGGVDAHRYPVLDGWSPLPSSPPGVASHWGEHGNMCAFDSLIAAPQAKIYDLGIGKTPGGITAFLSSALQAFQWALNRYRIDGTPQVLSNSWGLYRDSWDPFPPGNPGN